MSVLQGDLENIIISSLSLDQYHKCCLHSLAGPYWVEEITSESIHLGGIIASQDKSKIAHIPNLVAQDGGWQWGWTVPSLKLEDRPVVMENGWTRYVPGNYFAGNFKICRPDSPDSPQESMVFTRASTIR